MTHPYRDTDSIARGWRIERVGLGGGGEDAEGLRIVGGIGQRFQRGGAIFAASAGRGDMPAQLMGQELHTVANTQDGQTTVQDGRVAQGRALVIDAGWTA